MCDAQYFELWNTFVPLIISWCTIADVKITLPEDLEAEITEIRKLLEESLGNYA
jgi:hypothetical protein